MKVGDVGECEAEGRCIGEELLLRDTCVHPPDFGPPKAATFGLLHLLLLLTFVSLPARAPPLHEVSGGVQAGAGRAEPLSCPPLSLSLTARLIKNHINPKIAHVVLNQFEVSVRIK